MFADSSGGESVKGRKVLFEEENSSGCESESVTCWQVSHV
jgi:hypothetical protein